ncbi:MAG: two-component sensor kinase [Candidatus Scalindua rubra]|uniref:Two-component sensor kinase n=1 Tax=Candidatus Scalindua rubra TaxID=1872076 RepID=A0A1E3X8Z8_9BACT|nr:MAG: two-component sensor kinase [Candidatus Scalindua rubra]
MRLVKKFYDATGYQLRQVSSKYRNPKNKPDKFEEEALLEFGKDGNLSEYKGVDKINGQKVLRYLIPLYIEEACLKCHSAKETIPNFIREEYPEDKATDYAFGDLRGAISVVVPIDRAEAEIKGNLIHMTIVTTVGLTFLVTFIAIAINITIKKTEKSKLN